MDFLKASLGIELGSTRIKAVLIDENHIPVASGSYEWENQLVDGIWTYAMDDVRTGVRACFLDLKKNVQKTFGQTLTRVGAMGVSGMMHGYLPFDADWNLLAGFRTWRNTITGEAAAKLTEMFQFNIPQRWSIAHLYQAMLNGEAHVKDIAHLTTLAGYIHFLLTGENRLGVGEASGMFPIDSEKCAYDARMLKAFGAEAARMGYGWKVEGILPTVDPAGARAGLLSEAGAKLLDPEGELQPGIPVCPPEGDAGTGMVATNSVRVYTGNVSAGTSDFAMVVVDRLPGVHREIDMVTTPDGAPVAMVHCNNCTSDINAWVNLFMEFSALAGQKIEKSEAFSKLFSVAMQGEKDAGGLVSFNYLSGEGVLDLDEGRPVFLRTPDARLTLANFMRTHLMSALATLKIGMDILTVGENVRIEKLYAHGGFFKTPGVGQTLLSAAVNAPVSVMETAGEGGPYGMALLAAYMLNRADGETLADYLDARVFASAKSQTIIADEADAAGFQGFLNRYRKALDVEKAAICATKVN